MDYSVMEICYSFERDRAWYNVTLS